jgi:hypothetical protein
MGYDIQKFFEEGDMAEEKAAQATTNQQSTSQPQSRQLESEKQPKCDPKKEVEPARSRLSTERVTGRIIKGSDDHSS